MEPAFQPDGLQELPSHMQLMLCIRRVHLISASQPAAVHSAWAFRNGDWRARHNSDL